MELTLACPNDGQVEVGLDDVIALAFVGQNRVDVTFMCPRCGTPLRVSLASPSLLRAAMELAQYAMEEEPDTPGLPRTDPSRYRRRETLGGAHATEPVARTRAAATGGVAEDESVCGQDGRRWPAPDPRIEAYCQYFRMQLVRVECIEDFLRECD